MVIIFRELAKDRGATNESTGVVPSSRADRRLEHGLVDYIAGSADLKIVEALGIGLLDHPEATNFPFYVVIVSMTVTIEPGGHSIHDGNDRAG